MGCVTRYGRLTSPLCAPRQKRPRPAQAPEAVPRHTCDDAWPIRRCRRAVSGASAWPSVRCPRRYRRKLGGVPKAHRRCLDRPRHEPCVGEERQRTPVMHCTRGLRGTARASTMQQRTAHGAHTRQKSLQTATWDGGGRLRNTADGRNAQHTQPFCKSALTTAATLRA